MYPCAGVSIWWLCPVYRGGVWISVCHWPNLCRLFCLSDTRRSCVHLWEETSGKPLPDTPISVPRSLILKSVSILEQLALYRSCSLVCGYNQLSAGYHNLYCHCDYTYVNCCELFVYSLQMFQHYADVLTQGLKTKHRWWGGWDLGRRLPFVVIAAFIVHVRPSVILVS